MAITATTLSNNLNDTDTQLVVASATGITDPGINNANRKSLWIDYECFEVLGVNGTTITARRGYSCTLPRTHLAGAKVYIGADGDFPAFIGNGLGLGGMPMSQAFALTLPQTAADTATLTEEQIFGGLLTGTPTAAANYTTPTAALLVAALLSFGQPVLGQSFEFSIKNTSAGANTITVVAGTGVTVTGTATIAQNAIKRFKLVVTNVDAPAVTIYSLGASTF